MFVHVKNRTDIFKRQPRLETSTNIPAKTRYISQDFFTTALNIASSPRRHCETRSIHNRCTHLRSQVCAFDSAFQGRTHSDSLTLGQDFQAVNLRCDRISVSLWGIAARLPPDVPVREYQRTVVFIWNIIRYFHSHKHLHNSPLLHGLSAAAPAFLHSLLYVCTLRNLSFSYFTLIFLFLEVLELRRGKVVCACVCVCVGGVWLW